MDKKELLGYESPTVEIIEVEVEKGFATSTPGAEGLGNEEEL